MFKVNNKDNKLSLIDNKTINMFKVNNKDTRTSGVVLVSLSLTLNIFHTLFYCFYCC